MPDPIYLDYNATTPVASEVLDAMPPWRRKQYGNTSITQPYGRRAAQADARTRRRHAGLRLQRRNVGFADEGGRFIAVARLVPMFPVNLQDFALGLTRIRFATCTVTSAEFVLPGALAYKWIGAPVIIIDASPRWPVKPKGNSSSDHGGTNLAASDTWRRQ